MMQMIGPSVCTACGRVGMVTVPLANLGAGWDDCEACGGEGTEHVRVWWPASWFPGCVELVTFDRERRRLKLEPLVEATWQ